MRCTWKLGGHIVRALLQPESNREEGSDKPQGAPLYLKNKTAVFKNVSDIKEEDCGNAPDERKLEAGR